MSDLATKGIVGNGVGYGGNRDIHQRDAVAGKREGLVGRVGDSLAGSCERRINKHFVYRDITANIGCTRARRKRGR